MMGDGRKARNPKKTFGRLLKYLTLYKARIIIVLLCIFIAALVSAVSATALGQLVDEYIKPMIATGSTDFAGYVYLKGGGYQPKQ
jgi:ATP-binding cassette subfamily B protein